MLSRQKGAEEGENKVTKLIKCDLKTFLYVRRDGSQGLCCWPRKSSTTTITQQSNSWWIKVSKSMLKRHETCDCLFYWLNDLWPSDPRHAPPTEALHPTPTLAERTTLPTCSWESDQGQIKVVPASCLTCQSVWSVTVFHLRRVIFNLLQQPWWAEQEAVPDSWHLCCDVGRTTVRNKRFIFVSFYVVFQCFTNTWSILSLKTNYTLHFFESAGETEL